MKLKKNLLFLFYILAGIILGALLANLPQNPNVCVVRRRLQL